MSNELTHKQKQAIKCAYLDLVGSYQNRQDHDWKAHLLSMDDLQSEFPDILNELADEVFPDNDEDIS